MYTISIYSILVNPGILPGFICCVIRAGSTFHWVVQTECMYSTCVLARIMLLLEIGCVIDQGQFAKSDLKVQKQ